MSAFQDAVNVGIKSPVADIDPEFSRLLNAVARGELTVNEAWLQWRLYCSEAVEREKYAKLIGYALGLSGYLSRINLPCGTGLTKKTDGSHVLTVYASDQSHVERVPKVWERMPVEVKVIGEGQSERGDS